MKLKCTKTYYDKKKHKTVETGGIISVSKNRAAELIAAGVAEIVEDLESDNAEEVEDDGEA